ncbi:MAG TPA: RNA-directed DNA polymerase [Candidatus Absconditabacterales bacterium]|nr:RNA-directed DNA polymerase [Candidatus Absconditabacterales bacterium]
MAIFIFAGWRNPNNKKFNNIDKEFDLRCADGSNFNGNRNKWNNNKGNRNYGFSVRCLKDWLIESWLGKPAFIVFYINMLDTDKLLYDLFQAYYDTRQHKRNTKSAVDFEMNYESKIIELWNDLVNGTYTIRPSICFIIKDPIQREVFAADFRDRIIHHLIYNYIYELFDRHFIYDSYSCRLEKGTHFGIKRIEHFLRSCTQNYTCDAYILKLDIKGFFMHIDKHILFEKIETFLQSKKNKLTVDYDFLFCLIHQVIFHDSTHDCIIKGSKSDRDGLPDDKSLFHSSKDTGLAIGNLTSQLFANIYLDSLDKYIKYELGFSYYGRYVDDFVIIDTDKQKLLSAVSKIKDYLTDKLHLTLHPKKIYFQYYFKGVQFLGAYIKSYRTYIRKRTIGNFYKKIQEVNKSEIFDKELTQSIVNSYLGILAHYKTYKIRKKVLGNFTNRFWSQFHFKKSYTKAIPNIRKLKSSEVRNLYPTGYYNGNLR